MSISSESGHVAILMSTFNGMKYIKEQIESLLSQSCSVGIHIHIRDDGSTDSTLSYLRGLSQEREGIFIYEGENIGVVGSFMWLVKNIAGYNYYAFCDQDDVWQPLKLTAAINKLSEITGYMPQLYCSAYEYVDQNLITIGRFISNTDLSINNLLIENCAPGCTMVFNAALRNLYLQLNIGDISKSIVMHDWFFLLLARCSGDVLYDKNSYLLYRQHANNVVGIKSGVLSIFKNRWTQYKKEKARTNHLLFLQASLLKDICDAESFSGTPRLVIEGFVKSQNNFYSRLMYLLKSNTIKVRRLKKIDALLFTCLFLSGYYK